MKINLFILFLMFSLTTTNADSDTNTSHVEKKEGESTALQFSLDIISICGWRSCVSLTKNPIHDDLSNINDRIWSKYPEIAIHPRIIVGFSHILGNLKMLYLLRGYYLREKIKNLMKENDYCIECDLGNAEWIRQYWNADISLLFSPISRKRGILRFQAGAFFGVLNGKVNYNYIWSTYIYNYEVLTYYWGAGIGTNQFMKGFHFWLDISKGIWDYDDEKPTINNLGLIFGYTFRKFPFRINGGVKIEKIDVPESRFNDTKTTDMGITILIAYSVDLSIKWTTGNE